MMVFSKRALVVVVLALMVSSAQATTAGHMFKSSATASDPDVTGSTQNSGNTKSTSGSTNRQAPKNLVKPATSSPH